MDTGEKFPAGSRVRCVKAFAAVGNLAHGEEYTVVKSAAGYVRLEEDDFYLWREDRFELVEARHGDDALPTIITSFPLIDGPLTRGVA